MYLKLYHIHFFVSEYVCEGALVLQRAVAVREQLVGISPLLPPSFGIELRSSDPVVSAFTCSAIVPVLVLHF